MVDLDSILSFQTLETIRLNRGGGMCGPGPILPCICVKKGSLYKMYFIKPFSFTADELIMVGVFRKVVGSPGWQNIVFPLRLLSWPPLFVSSPSISPGRHSRISQVAYLLVSQCNFPSAAHQPELTDDWLVPLHSSPLIVLKWSRSVRPKIHFP